MSGPPVSQPGEMEEMSVHAEQPREDNDQEDTPFEAENTFQLYAKYEYLSAGMVTATCQSTIFHAMDKVILVAYPYMPFFSEEEWSLAEFLTPSCLSKGSINSF
ncbi:hypothetical protein M422DRAFT_45910 [Sphaerobolus stellatus SS14]|uniref:Methionyl/Valyl/Leucyl/Isoleucyl-tRNA synthetase anticodon-binding domain-containing protein n=1 Tax=Sphaerobolus stellatus (strain SS14) TaxID=990650 RepID=A0A0C9UVF6_SPHS4|nr:hypothetical protein M422DRAFT_45910 [Sphaerobolus stellatus SS14]